MNILITILDFFQKYSDAIQALTPFILILLAVFFSRQFRDVHFKDGQPATYVGRFFISLFGRYKILAVHQYQKSDDISGYSHLGQNSRPDQWRKLIEIKTIIPFFLYYVKPKKSNLILTIVISRDTKEPWKNIDINK